jgi:hypothetical protein
MFVAASGKMAQKGEYIVTFLCENWGNTEN